MSKSKNGKKNEKAPSAAPAVEQKQQPQADVQQEAKPQGAAPLDPAEELKLEQYETVIKQGLGGFLSVGKALKAIRDERLYRAKSDRFEDYCREQWGLSDKYAHRLVKAYDVVTNLQSELKNSPNGETRLPSNESQVRPLATLDPKQQVKAWQQVVKNCEGKPITADEVEAAADKVAGKTPTKPSTSPTTELKEANSKLGEIGELVTKALEGGGSKATVTSLKEVLEKIQKLLGAKK